MSACDAEASLLQRGLQFLEENDEKRAGAWLVWLLLVLVRWMVGLHSYSGEHTPPMFGDYEAQRHWMEITTSLPVSDWYFNTTSNDLLYWGLDYPPLTAYVSYLLGRAAGVTEPAMVELASSRGYESATSKVFMRTSVVLCDVALFIPAIYYVARALYGSEQWTRRTAFLLLILLQPAVVLIDHGHFQRIFPFGRGLFEDKVANFWCIADFVLKIRRHVTPTLQMRLCTVMTFIGFSPSVIDLLRRKPTNLRFVLSLAICSLSFFLFSFQVHEKTILLPLLPISFLFAHNALLSGWFSVLSAFSMYFLLQKDGLVLPYIVLQLAYVSVAVVPFLTPGTAKHLHVQQTELAPGYEQDGSTHPLFRAYVMLSLVGIVVIHAAQVWITPPARYPHIHDYVFAAYSCGHFLLVLVYLTYWQWTAETHSKKAKKE
ncbi:Glucosyltransferase-like protein [Phytophthora pseudosyringae]|uniref:Alpha-1,3-glucosyltransferase n=1 Tax=Phytophthora pseudosyringae TaxID=221518 RepID=A0A8T1WG80_9STRA|nr:Glucosyltransferase-like protein [Phytophthora pseudosyringae]